MSWDIKYRPTRYADVIGQDATVAMLKSIVSAGEGFQQSYLLAGPYGTGKTTLGRILARALLCRDPQGDGEPCDKCPTCLEMLDRGYVESFTEVDAATNSGKDNIKRILETLDYSSFTGSRRIYLFDESHRLSTDALDALLIPMEDTIKGSMDRRLVCIFCTTEPEKMRATIGSRCGPTFTIRTPDVETIASRLAFVLESEGQEYEYEALERISLYTEGHIRDCLQTCERLCKMGGVTASNLANFLNLESAHLFGELLVATSRTNVLADGCYEELLRLFDPGSIYARLSQLCLKSFQHGKGLSKPDYYWTSGILSSVYQTFGDRLLAMGRLFANRPRRATREMLACDVLLSVSDQYSVAPATGPVSTSAPKAAPVAPVKKLPTNAKGLTRNGVYLPDKGIRRTEQTVAPSNTVVEPGKVKQNSMDIELFASAIKMKMRELRTGG